MKLTAKKIKSADINQIIESKIKWLTLFSEPIKIILFGSAVSYEMTEASDIDLIVIYKTHSDLKEIEKTLYQNRPKNDWPHDLFLYTIDGFEESKKKGGGICWLSEKEGKIIYEKS